MVRGKTIAFLTVAFLVSRIYELRDRNREHHSFACATKDVPVESLPPEEIAADAGLQTGQWQLVSTGEADGVPYAVFADAGSGPTPFGGFDWRYVRVRGEDVTCAVPIA